MSDTDIESSTNLKIRRIHGKRNADYSLWHMRLRAAGWVKGDLDVVAKKKTATNVQRVSSSSDTASSSQQPKSSSTSHDREKQEKVSAPKIFALGDAPLRVAMDAEDDPVRVLEQLDARYASNRTISKIAVQTQLFRMSYTGQNRSNYIDQFTSLLSQLERMGKDIAIPNTRKAPVPLASIDPK